jgi:hypothetical protein
MVRGDFAAAWNDERRALDRATLRAARRSVAVAMSRLMWASASAAWRRGYMTGLPVVERTP